MNTENMQRVIDILNNTDPKTFDMKDIFDSENGTKCVIGIIDEHIKDVLPHEFMGIDPYDYGGDMDKWFYIVHANWAEHASTNTIEHACFRINRIMEGYEPRSIEIEVPKHIFTS